MKLFIVILPFLVVSCSLIKKKDSVVLVKEEPPALGTPETTKLRYPESLRKYSVGRYVDPGNGLVMHEAHDLYRIESTGKWNHHPHRGISALSQNEVDPSSQSSDSTPEKIARLQRELSREREASRAVITANETMRTQIAPLTTALENAKILVDQNAELRRQLSQARSTQKIPAEVPKPESTPKASFKDWLDSPKDSNPKK